MASVAKALVFGYAGEAFAAVPAHAAIGLVEVGDGNALIEVPAAPAHCRHLVRWQGQVLPALDLLSLLIGAERPWPSEARHVLVVAYRTGAGEEIGLGALMVVGLPQAATVSDDMVCPFPANSRYWSHAALSCFDLEGVAVPILDTARLFGAAHSAHAT